MRWYFRPLCDVISDGSAMIKLRWYYPSPSKDIKWITAYCWRNDDGLESLMVSPNRSSSLFCWLQEEPPVVQFHQHLMPKFLLFKCFAELFSSHILAVPKQPKNFTGGRFEKKKIKSATFFQYLSPISLSNTITDMAKVRHAGRMRPLDLFLLWEKATYRSSTIRNLVKNMKKHENDQKISAPQKL